MEPAKKILFLTKPNGSTPWMHLVDDFLDPEKATDLTNCLLSMLEPYATFIWLDSKSHLPHRCVPMNIIGQIQDPTEDNDQYREGLRLIDAAPQRQTDEEAEWLKCAIIVSAALSFMAKQGPHGNTRFSEKGRLYYFNPGRFYNYMWICLHEGCGTSAWIIEPPQPPEDLDDDQMADWYVKKAEAIVTQVRARWNQGMWLRTLLLRWAPSDMQAVDVA